MNTIKLYANYGVLAHENKPVFTINHPVTEAYDLNEYILPEGWEVAEDQFGMLALYDPTGYMYLEKSIGHTKDELPVLYLGIGKKVVLQKAE